MYSWEDKQVGGRLLDTVKLIKNIIFRPNDNKKYIKALQEGLQYGDSSLSGVLHNINELSKKVEDILRIQATHEQPINDKENYVEASNDLHDLPQSTRLKKEGIDDMLMLKVYYKFYKDAQEEKSVRGCCREGISYFHW